MRRSKLKPEQLEKVEYLLYFNDDLRSVYYLKELFYEILDCEDGTKGKEMLTDTVISIDSEKEYYICSITKKSNIVKAAA